MTDDIGGKVVVITGATSGLGEAGGTTARTGRGRAGPGRAAAGPAEGAVVYAIGQPDDMDINDILFRPTRQGL